MIYIPDHVERGLANVLSQFRLATKLRAIIAAILEEVQIAEDTLADLAVGLTVDGAQGAQLDLMGALLGERRDALSDLWYRRFLYARAAIRVCQGTPDEVSQIAATLTGAPVAYSPAYPAGFRLFIAPQPTMDAVLLARLKARKVEASPSGDGFDLTFVDSPTPFTVDEDGFGFDDGDLVEVL
jgi:hypothetical protein